MTQEIIGMDDMMAIYEVTDRSGKDRDTTGVLPQKEGAGAVPTPDWPPTLKADLQRLGFELQKSEDEQWCK